MNRLVILFVLTLLPFNLLATNSHSAFDAPRFASLEGRFSISLPNRPGSKRLAIATPFGNAHGDVYEWTTKEGNFGIGYADSLRSFNDPEAAKQFFDKATESFHKLAAANGGSIAIVKRITLDKHPGIEQRADLFTGSVIQRLYVVSRRIYETSVLVKNSQREHESAAFKVLDSFRLLSDPEITEEALKAGPGPLPQKPEAPRAGSDAGDEGLRGRVKSVRTELQNLSETPLTQVDTRFSLTTYDQKGNKLKTESYDFRNNLSLITVFGYLDGARVSASKSVEREYSLPVVRMGSPQRSNREMDPRYQHRFEFKYDEKKRLIEHTDFLSDGEIMERYVYKYEGNQKEEMLYTGNGKLARRYLYLLDDKGNVVERTGFDRNGALASKISYTYEFDSHGNWTKRTMTRNMQSDKPQPPSVHLRTITYY
jgi:hypothetical protein